MVARVNGGILTDQMLKGTITYYEMTGPFTNTISLSDIAGVIVPGQAVVGDIESPVTYQYRVGKGQPVPESAADRAFAVILEHCTVVQIALISDTTIQFAVESTDNGWNTTSLGPFNAAGLDSDSDAAANMQAAIRALGVQGVVTSPIPLATDTPPAVPDLTTTGTTADMSAVTVLEKEFILA